MAGKSKLTLLLELKNKLFNNKLMETKRSLIMLQIKCMIRLIGYDLTRLKALLRTLSKDTPEASGLKAIYKHLVIYLLNNLIPIDKIMYSKIISGIAAI